MYYFMLKWSSQGRQMEAGTMSLLCVHRDSAFIPKSVFVKLLAAAMLFQNPSFM